MSLSRIEEILTGGEVKPQSRIEQILMGEDIVPQSRIEVLLKEKLGGGGSGSKTVTITWDGDTSGLVSVADSAYKVANYTAVTKADLVGCMLSLQNDPNNPEPFAIEEELINDTFIPHAILISDYAIFVSEPTSAGPFNFTEAGIYFFKSGEMYTASLTYGNETITPTGTIEITENGEHDVAKYAKANVNVSGGGGAITDGVVITARDADGFPTEADFYGDKVWDYAFSYNGYYYHESIGWKKLNKLNLKNAAITVGIGCFSYLPVTEIGNISAITNLSSKLFQGCSNLVEVNLPNAETKNIPAQPFMECTSLKVIKLPKVFGEFSAGTYPIAENCTSLETVEIGSIGYPLKNNSSSNSFKGCTQTGLTITVFSTDADKDALLTSIRNGATNATIIIKDSTTGETLVTSTP